MKSNLNFQIIQNTKVSTLAELKDFWKLVIRQQLSEKTLCLLVGPLGSGKTDSIKQIFDICNFKEAASPSFAIHHRAVNSKGQTLDHVDLYRLKDQDDLESTGFWDLFSVEKSWIFVEWADLVDDSAWPLDWPTIKVEIQMLGLDQRSLILSRLVR